MKALRVAIVVAAVLVHALPAAADADGGPAINYISADAVYVNVGSRAGLEAGARVTVIRDGVEIAVLEAVHVSSNSASCRVVSQSSAPRVGDSVFFTAVERRETAAPSAPKPAPVLKATTPPPTTPRIRGSVALESQWQRDLEGSELSSVQPGVRLRLWIPQPLGVPGTLRVRHRTRLYHRSEPLSTEGDTDEWSHRLSEFGWYFDGAGIRDAVGFGRVLNPFIRGLGYLDGGYATVGVGRHYRVGVAGGLDPRIEDSSLQPDQQKYGVFFAYEAGTYDTRRFASTLAFSGSYNGGVIDREFGYVQYTFSVVRRLSLYHSMEVDFNRGWRRDAANAAVSFSNSYATAHATVTDYLSLDASYDTRRNVRDYQVHDSPDSLFDDALSTGYSGGVSLDLPRHVRLRARAGVRTREHEDTRNRHASASVTAAHFPLRGHSLSARISISDTPFVTGYRPSLSYRFPLLRRTLVTIGGGAYIYDQSFDRIVNGFGELGVHHTFGRYYASGHARRISGAGMDSITLIAEVGIGL